VQAEVVVQVGEAGVCVWPWGQAVPDVG
jgi:hypothetical protein